MILPKTAGVLGKGLALHTRTTVTESGHETFVDLPEIIAELAASDDAMAELFGVWLKRHEVEWPNRWAAYRAGWQFGLRVQRHGMELAESLGLTEEA